MAFVGKSYAHERDENFDAFVDSLGVSTEKLRKVKPKQKLEKNGDTFTLTAIFDTETKEINFKIGEEFEDNSVPGRPAKTIFTLDGNTLTEVQTYADGNVVTTKREYFDDKLIVTLTKNNWDGKAIRYYKV